jgi:hypothetical protein
MNSTPRTTATVSTDDGNRQHELSKHHANSDCAGKQQ